MSCNSKINDFYQGDTVPIKVTIKDSEGTAIDITGSTITMVFKINIDDVDPGVIVRDAVLSDPTNGEALITLSSADTNIEPKEYYYNIDWVDVSGNIRTLQQNTVSILEKV